MTRGILAVGNSAESLDEMVFEAFSPAYSN
jgi:hypothetical protein